MILLRILFIGLFIGLLWILFPSHDKVVLDSVDNSVLYSVYNSVRDSVAHFAYEHFR